MVLHSRNDILCATKSVIFIILYEAASSDPGLTERAIGDALSILLEPSVRIEDGCVLSPDFGHAREDIVLITNNVASMWRYITD